MDGLSYSHSLGSADFEVPAEDSVVGFEENAGQDRLVFKEQLKMPLGAGVKRVYGHWHDDAQGSQWRIFFCPSPLKPLSHQDSYTSVMLQWESTHLEQRHVQFKFALVLLEDENHSLITTPMAHKFDREHSCWGLHSFVSQGIVFNPSNRFCQHAKPTDGRAFTDCFITIAVEIEYIPDFFPNAVVDSDRNILVGLKNQGATCYMNSLLQTFYHLNHLRSTVYSIPCAEEDSVTSVSFALQRLFYQLQTSNTAVVTRKLTQAFEWDRYESFMQQDIQEFSRVLCDKLEEKLKTKMKGTNSEHLFRDLFEGKFCSFVSCVNVNYESSREETFHDIQLDVRGCQTLEASFQKYIQVEMLQGDNQYDAEGHGKQDARKGVDFVEFPPVLNIHLKRFEYDYTSGLMRKVNDRLEFNPVLDLGRFVNANRPNPNQPSEVNHCIKMEDDHSDNLFILHSILVHSGSAHGGHYYAFINLGVSEEKSDWYKFDDAVVTKVSEQEAIEGSYGMTGSLQRRIDPNTFFLVDKIREYANPYTSAYMLVYIKRSTLPFVMGPVDESNIPEELKKKLKDEAEEELRKEQEEQDQANFTEIIYALETHLANMNNYSNYSVDFVDVNGTIKTDFDVEKIRFSTPLEKLLEIIEQQTGISKEFLCCWSLGSRENKTYRIDEYVSPKKIVQAPMKLFIEQRSSVARPLTEDEVLIFMKFYDPRVMDECGPLKYLGSRIFQKNDACQIIVDALKERLLEKDPLILECGFELEVLENVHPRMLIPLEVDKTLDDAELTTGDIIIAQVRYPPYKKNSEDETSSSKIFPSEQTVKEFFEYRCQRRTINFLPRKSGVDSEHGVRFPSEEDLLALSSFKKCVPYSLHERQGFTLELCCALKYRAVLASVAKVLKMNTPTQIRLYLPSRNDPSKPHFYPVKIMSKDLDFDGYCLRKVLKHEHSCSEEQNTFFFEILPFTMDELDSSSGNKLLEIDIMDKLAFESCRSATPANPVRKKRRLVHSQEWAKDTPSTEFFLLHYNKCIQDLFEEICGSHEGMPQNSTNLRLCEVFKNQISQVLRPDFCVRCLAPNSLQEGMGIQSTHRYLLEILPDSEALPEGQFMTIQVAWYRSAEGNCAILHHVPMAVTISQTDTLRDLVKKICARRVYSVDLEECCKSAVFIDNDGGTSPIPFTDCEELVSKLVGSFVSETTVGYIDQYNAVQCKEPSIFFLGLREKFPSAVNKKSGEMIGPLPCIGFYRPAESKRPIIRASSGIKIGGS